MGLDQFEPINVKRTLLAQRFHRARPSALRTALLAGVAAFAGCMHPAPNDPSRIGPFFSPQNHVGEPTLGGIRRVVLLPLATAQSALNDSAAELDPVLLTALQQQQRFEIVVLSRDECRRRFRTESLVSSSALPHDLLAILRRDFAADAVLFVDLTVFQAYRPLEIGLRAKLASMDGMRLLWSFDQVFSTTDPAVANSARNHYLGADRGEMPADLTPAVLQSPSKFAGYAAAAMFQTLPPVKLAKPGQPNAR